MPDPGSRDPPLLGVVVGWIRFPGSWREGASPRTMILRLQTAKNIVAYKKGEIDEHDVALSIIQLRQLAEDLIRGADELEGRDSRKERRRRSWWP